MSWRTWALTGALAALALLALVLLMGSANASHSGGPTCSSPTLSGTLGSNGWYQSSVTATLSSAGAEISYRNYSVDGSPFVPYTAPVSVPAQGHHNFTCQVVDHNGVWANYTAPTFRIDSIAPTSCASASVRDTSTLATIPPGANSWYGAPSGSANVQDHLTAVESGSGIASYGASVDGSSRSVVTSSGSFYVQVTSEGSHSIGCSATDNAGNPGTTLYHTLRLDVTPPTCSVSASGTTSGNAGWTRGAGSYSITTSDALSGVWYSNYTLDAAPQAAYTGPLSLADGNRTLACIVKDQAGNAYTQSYAYKIDTTAPTACSLPRAYDPARGADITAQNGWFRPLQPSFYGVYMYPAGVDGTSGAYYFSLAVDGSFPSTVYAGAYLTVYGEGVRSVTCTVHDTAGNTATFSLPLRIDSTPPTCSGSHTGVGGSNGWYRSGGFTVTGNDGGSGIWFVNHTISGSTVTKDSAETTQGPASLSQTTSREGAYLVNCVVTDLAGHVSGAANYQARIDATPPTCAGSFSGKQGDAGWYVDAGIYTLNATDAASGVALVSYRLDTTASRSYAPFTLRSDGEHIITCEASDHAGHIASTPLTLKLDAAPPTCSASAIDANGKAVTGIGGWYGSAVDLKVAVQDPTSGVANVSLTLDTLPVPGLTLASPTTSVTLHVDDRGIHEVRCSARDIAGNAREAVVFDVNIDDTLPTCTATPSPTDSNSGWHRSGATLALSAADTGSGLATFESSVDGGPFSAYATPIVVKGDGNHRIECRVWDVAGNAAVEVFDMRVDATPPSCDVTVDGVAEGMIGKPPVTVTLNGKDNTSGVARLAFVLNGGAEILYLEPIELAEPGIHDIVCHITDEAGNTHDALVRRVRLETDIVGEKPATLPQADDITTTEPKRVPAGHLWAFALAVALALRRRERA